MDLLQSDLPPAGSRWAKILFLHLLVFANCCSIYKACNPSSWILTEFYLSFNNKLLEYSTICLGSSKDTPMSPFSRCIYSVYHMTELLIIFYPVCSLIFMSVWFTVFYRNHIFFFYVYHCPRYILSLSHFSLFFHTALLNGSTGRKYWWLTWAVTSTFSPGRRTE